MVVIVFVEMQFFAGMNAYSSGRDKCQPWPETRGGLLMPGYGIGCWLAMPLHAVKVKP